MWFAWLIFATLHFCLNLVCRWIFSLGVKLQRQPTSFEKIQKTQMSMKLRRLRTVETMRRSQREDQRKNDMEKKNGKEGFTGPACYKAREDGVGVSEYAIWCEVLHYHFLYLR